MRGHSDCEGRGHTGYQYEPRDFEDFDMLIFNFNSIHIDRSKMPNESEEVSSRFTKMQSANWKLRLHIGRIAIPVGAKCLVTPVL